MTQISALLSSAIARARANDVEGALAEIEGALDAQPDEPTLLGFAALCALQLNRPERAVPLLQRQLAAVPNDQAARLNLATSLTKLDRGAEALALISEHLDNPKMARVGGYLYQQEERLDEAIAAYRTALTAFPEDWESWNNLGNCLAGLQQRSDAITAFENAINRSPKAPPEIFLNLTKALTGPENREKRVHAAEEAFSRYPDNKDVMVELGLALSAMGLYDKAGDMLRQAVALERDFGEARLELGLHYETSNQLDRLEALIAESEQFGDSAELSFLRAWSLRRHNRFEEAALVAAEIPDTISPMRTAQLRAEIADRLGRVDEAFDHYREMNLAAVASNPAGPEQTFRASIVAETETMPSPPSRPLPHDPALPRDPIFIVGSPRSGTTLLDTLLSGMPELQIFEEMPMLATVESEYPHLAGCNDLDILAAAKRRYFDLASRTQGAPEDRRIVDKMPLHMTHMPIISRLFPDAAIILVERHPCDAVLSCFMANFTLNNAMRSYSDLDEAARTYDAIFANWEKAHQLYSLNVHTVRYERMIVDLETEMRSLLSFLNLPWRDAVLDNQTNAEQRGVVRTASYSQIGEPLYSRAVGRWEKYRQQLLPILPILQPWIDKMGYDAAR